MTVQSSYAPITYQGDGITTVFAFPWEFQAVTDIVVSTTVVATGVVTPLVYGTNYTVIPATAAQTQPNGSIALTVALPVGTDVTIARAPDIDQTSTWVENFSNPAKLYENAIDKLTMIVQDLDYTVQNLPDSGGGGTAIVTTAIFAIAVVGIAQTVSVNSTAGLTIGNNVQISNSAYTMIGQVTALTTTTITLTTLAIVAGTAGTNMPVGAAVQLASVSGNSAILAQDAVIAPTQATTLQFGASAALAAGQSTIDLYISDFTAGVARVKALATGIRYTGLIQPTTGSGWSVVGFNSSSSFMQRFVPGVASAVLKNAADFSSLSWGLLDATNINPGSLTPALLQSTNSAADTQIPSYNLATGKFTWVNLGGGGLPGGGNAGQFLNGTPAWTQWLNTSLGDGAFFFSNSGATNAYAGFLTQTVGTPAGFNISVDIGVAKYNGTNWLGANNGVFKFWGAIAAKVGGIGAYNSIDASNVEVAQFGSTTTNFITDIVRAGGFRSGAGFWQYAFTLAAPGASVTVDLKNGAYQRHTGIVNNVSITLADATPAPTAGSYQYANELTLEINAPGANLYTWPGTVTWANGASAPTLSTTGINLLKFVRRQGQTQWVGYVLNTASGGTYTNANAQDAVGLASGSGGLMTATATITPAYISHTSLAFNVNTGSIGNTQLASGIAINKLAGFPSNAAVYLDGSGNWSAPAGGGGFSVAVPHTWTGIQNFTVPQNFNGTFAGLGSSTISTSINNFYPNIAYSDAAGIAVYIQDSYATPPGGGGIKVADLRRIVTASVHGCNSFYNEVDLRSTLTDGFSIGMTTITESKRITGTAAADGMWINSWSPCALFSATPDATGVIHTWTTGFVRAGEINYGNAWQDWGLVESVLGTHYSGGFTFVPDWLAGSTGATTENHYDAQWAILIAYAGADSHGHAPQNHIGLFVHANGISPGGYGLCLQGSSGTFNGASASTNAPGALIKFSSTCKTGIDFAGTTGDSTVCTATNTGNPMITMVDDQSIKFGSIWLRGHSGALQFSTDGSSWTSVTIP